MKKIMTLVVALACAATTFAQNPVGSIKVTPMVGVTVASMTNTDDSKSRIGLVAGAEAQYQLTDVFAISGGVLYTMQGVKGEESAVTSTIKNDYINVPILVNAYVAPGLAVKLGLQPGYLVNSKYEMSVKGSSADTKTDDMFNKFDLALPIGVSYEYHNIVLDARYNWGLLNQLKESVIDIKSNNSVFQVTLGYRF